MKKKGFTLVEIVVSIALFSVMVGAIFSCYFLARNANIKHKEYLYFENICLEIDYFYDKYGTNWEKNYYGSDSKDDIYYYNNNYEKVDEKSKYELSFKYNENNEMILSIKNLDKNYFVIENLNYGGFKNA